MATLTNEQSHDAFMRVFNYQESQFIHSRTPLQGDVTGQFLEAFPVGARVEMSILSHWPWRAEGTVVAHGTIPTPKVTYEGEDLRGITVWSDEGEEFTYQASHMPPVANYTENAIRPIVEPSREETRSLVEHPVFELV